MNFLEDKTKEELIEIIDIQNERMDEMKFRIKDREKRIEYLRKRLELAEETINKISILQKQFEIDRTRI